MPDLAGWRRQRVPEVLDVAYWTIRPDWLCEVLSPSTRAIDIGPKRGIYAREGVPHMWLIDPKARSLEAFELRGGNFALVTRRTGDQLVSVPPFEAINFSLAELWADSTLHRGPGRHPQVHDRPAAV